MTTIDKNSFRHGQLPKGLRAIITGASTGIGRALAVQLARECQSRLILNARGAEELEKAAAEVRSAGGTAYCVAGDIADESIRADIISTGSREFAGIDVLVNNAGLTRSGPMPALDPADWRYVFEVNFFAALSLTYAVLPGFLAQGYGKVVNVASVAGKVSFPGSVCYAASKFALTGFSEGMAAEFAGKIDVITVCPGWVRTEFFRKNKMADDPSSVAEEENFRGWLMKNMLSISSEQASADIVRALRKGGSHEMVLTAPGVIIERLSGLFPEFTHYLATLVPSERGKIAPGKE